MKAKKIVYYLLAVTALTLTASACKPKISGVGDVVVFKDMTIALNSVEVRDSKFDFNIVWEVEP